MLLSPVVALREVAPRRQSRKRFLQELELPCVSSFNLPLLEIIGGPADNFRSYYCIVSKALGGGLLPPRPGDDARAYIIRCVLGRVLQLWLWLPSGSLRE